LFHAVQRLVCERLQPEVKLSLERLCDSLQHRTSVSHSGNVGLHSLGLFRELTECGRTNTCPAITPERLRYFQYAFEKERENQRTISPWMA
jgi:hypothetical protein